jgi:hypothetical protein
MGITGAVPDPVYMGMTSWAEVEIGSMPDMMTLLARVSDPREPVYLTLNGERVGAIVRLASDDDMDRYYREDNDE